MARSNPFSWLLLLPLLARTAGAGVVEIPAVNAPVGTTAASGASAGSGTQNPSLSPGLAPSLTSPAPLLAAPLPAPAPLPAAAAAAPVSALPAAPLAVPASRGAERYEPSVPPPAEAHPAPSEKKDGLRQLTNSLTARGDLESLDLARKIYYTDPLTGLPNRSYFMERAAQAAAGIEDATVAMLDMNNFGAVNIGLAEKHGVTAGRARADAVLAGAGAVLGALAKNRGVTVIRLGGEEFVALGSRKDVFALAGEAQAVMTPDRLLEAVGITAESDERAEITRAMERLGRAGQPAADFTYGVAELRGRTLDEAVGAADAALMHAKEDGRRGAIIAETQAGFVAWTAEREAVQTAARAELPKAETPKTLADVERLESRLQGKEKALFREAAFKDPLTLTRTYDYVALRAGEWDKRYARGGQASLISARNLKQINDLLGHEAGDRYLRKLGVVMRQSINKSRNESKLDAQEPVRVASKEFLVVGLDADVVSQLAAKAIADSFEDGRMLTSAEVAQLREQAASKGLVPRDRIKLIGTVRVVTERLDDGRGHANTKAALDRVFERLEAHKKIEGEGGMPPGFSPN